MVVLRSREVPLPVSKPALSKTGSTHEPITPIRTTERSPTANRHQSPLSSSSFSTSLSQTPSSTVRRSNRFASKSITDRGGELSLGNSTRKRKAVTRNLLVEEASGKLIDCNELDINRDNGNDNFSSGFLNLRSGKRVVKRKVVNDINESDKSIVEIERETKEKVVRIDINELIATAENCVDTKIEAFEGSKANEEDDAGGDGVDDLEVCASVDESTTPRGKKRRGHSRDEKSKSKVVDETQELAVNCANDKSGECDRSKGDEEDVDVSNELKDQPPVDDEKRSKYSREEKSKEELVDEPLEVVENCVDDEIGEFGEKKTQEDDGDIVDKLKHVNDKKRNRYRREEKGKKKLIDEPLEVAENCVDDERGEFGVNKTNEEGNDVLDEMKVHPRVSNKKRNKYSREEKGKGKLIDEGSHLGDALMQVESEMEDLVGMVERVNLGSQFGKGNARDMVESVNLRSQFGKGNARDMVESVNLGSQFGKGNARDMVESVNLGNQSGKENARESQMRMGQFRDIARKNASRFAHFVTEEEQEEEVEEEEEEEEEEEQKTEEDWPGPFSTAMKIIRDREYKINTPRVASGSEKAKPVPIKWTPRSNSGFNNRKVRVPSLQELSLKSLAHNADAITSLNYVPDPFRHRLCQLLCNTRRMSGRFLDLLVRDSPAEIRIADCSLLTEEEFSKHILGCNTNNLTVLQLDHCGHCLPDYIVVSKLARSPMSLPALTTLSLSGAYRLSDVGLSSLVSSAPALQSVNLNHCSLLTAASIDTLSNSLGAVLRELYIDDCQSIDAMHILPALKKLEHLEVLSVAGMQTVCDKFLRNFIVARGHNLKGLVLTDCVKLTDSSLKVIAEGCSNLQMLDLFNLRKLTDSSLGYLSNGCLAIESLKLRQNQFSDEAVAAYLELKGETLKELSLNNVKKVAHNTAFAIARQANRLRSLDLSWCRNLSDEALGLIVDSCLSLRVLKVFGCTQITDVFLHGHSNPEVEIIGTKLSPVLEHIRLPNLEELITS